ncbi:MAG: sulfite exporter TauE/SafE family protein [Verrucomicrobiaceae bacterium]|nr:sulfite exporter TauE/SafE family protein [Verrucomicrobiaceae bacterium]
MNWLSEHTLLPADPWLLLLATFGAMCIGMSKAGLSGTATLNVVLMAHLFGAKASVGIILPMLIAADFMGYWINRHGGSWLRVLPMVPPAIVGVIVGWWLLDKLDNQAARIVIGWLILALLAFNLLLNRRRQDFVQLAEHRLFAWSMGCMAGVVTMLANAAGPVMTVYLLAQHLEKKEHLGVFSRFFLFINLFKAPFSANLGIIHSKSLLTNLALLPGVILGVLIGWQILKRLPQKPFEHVLFWLTAFAALWMIR